MIQKIRNNEKLWSILRNVVLPLAILGVGVGTVLYYIIGPSAGYMTSDCTDSLRWSMATFESGKLISDEFYYAAILPFGGNLIFLPFIAMFGYSLTAQIWGLCFFALALAAALYYMASGFGFDRIRSSALVSIVFLIMSASPKLREIMWEHIFYYNLGILFFCLGFGLACRIIREGGICFDPKAGRPMDWVRLGILLVFSVIAATDGLQALICFTLPLFCGIFAERFLDSSEKLFSKRNLLTVAFIGAVVIASGIGFISIDKVSGGVTAAYADAYSTWSGSGSWVNNFLGFFPNWFTLLGVSVVQGDPLASMDSLPDMLFILGGIVLLVAPIVLLCFYKKIESAAIRAVLIGHFAVSAFILFAVTFGKLGGANWRLTPMLGTSCIVTAVAAFEFIRLKGIIARIGALLLALLLVMAFVPAAEIAEMPADYGRDNSWHTAARVLKEHDLKYGYANFWWAEIITMLSDGEVEVANIAEGKTTPVKYPYQLNHNSFEDKEGVDRYFLLLTESENKNMSSYITVYREMGKIVEEFTVESEPYNLRGYTGKLLYVYVFSENIF